MNHHRFRYGLVISNSQFRGDFLRLTPVDSAIELANNQNEGVVPTLKNIYFITCDVSVFWSQTLLTSLIKPRYGRTHKISITEHPLQYTNPDHY
jgi:hypothetical protein